MNSKEKVFLGLTILVSLVIVCGLGAGKAEALEYTITQITNNDFSDRLPQIDAGQIVWQGYDGHDSEIFLYDIATGTTTQITDNDYDDYTSQIDNGRVVWKGGAYENSENCEIFLYNVATEEIIQLTDDDTYDSYPQIDNGYVVWQGRDGNNPEGHCVLFLYDIAIGTTIQIPGEACWGNVPKIDNGQIIWYPAHGGWLFYDVATGITTEPFYSYTPASINNGQIVYLGKDGDDYEIFLYDIATGTSTQITDNAYWEYGLQIDNGYIVWSTDVEGKIGQEIFLYEIATGTTTQITDNDYCTDEYPRIDNDQIVWNVIRILTEEEEEEGVEEPVPEILLYEIATGTTTPLTGDSYWWHLEDYQIDNGQIVWSAGYFDPVTEEEVSPEIFLATPTELPPPVADANGPYIGNEGSPITFDASDSSDPDGDSLTYSWDLDGDGYYDDAAGPIVTYTWYDDYSGTVAVEVSDGEYTDTDTATVTVYNVAPTASIDNVVQPYSEFILPGDVLEFTGSYTDPGTLDDHTYEWDFDDGTIVTGTLTPIHAYTEPGPYTVTLNVTDDDGDMGTASVEIVVESPAGATDDVIEDVEEMDLPTGIETALTSTLDAAINSLDNGQTTAAVNQLGAFINQVEAQRGKKLTDEEADALIAAAQWIIDNLNGG